MKKPVRIAVTGAAGQIGYSLLFRIANGDMLGRDQPVLLQLLELPIDKAQAALKGVMMELEDCAFPLLAGMSGSGDPKAAFKDAEMALLVGARPRGPGMERKDLLLENARIFIEQGKAMDAVASRGVKVLVVGNPANTNAYIAMKSAPRSAAEKLHRDVAARSQSRAVAACGQVGQAGRIDRQADRLGQSFADDVSGLSIRDSRRAIAEGADQRRELEPHGVPADRRQTRRRGHRGPWTVVGRRRPPTPRSTTCATGSPAAAAGG